MFGDHAVAIGFVLSFSPYVYEVIVALIFVILRLAYEFRMHKYDHHIKFIKTSTLFFTSQSLELSIYRCWLLPCWVYQDPISPQTASAWIALLLSPRTCDSIKIKTIRSTIYITNLIFSL